MFITFHGCTVLLLSCIYIPYLLLYGFIYACIIGVNNVSCSRLLSLTPNPDISYHDISWHVLQSCSCWHCVSVHVMSCHVVCINCHHCSYHAISCHTISHILLCYCVFMTALVLHVACYLVMAWHVMSWHIFQSSTHLPWLYCLTSINIPYLSYLLLYVSVIVVNIVSCYRLLTTIWFCHYSLQSCSCWHTVLYCTVMSISTRVFVCLVGVFGLSCFMPHIA